MTRYFVVAHSFAAPFVSDESTDYVDGKNPDEALRAFARAYNHPCGLYAANLYASADAYHMNEKPLARWLCNHEREKRRVLKPLECGVYRGEGPGKFYVNDKLHVVKNPKGGDVVVEG